MKIVRILTIITLLVSVANIHLFAQTAPKYSNDFLGIGVGARALGLGNAVTSSSDDITSVYWNPASLHELDRKMEIGAMHSEYYAGISKYDFIGVSYKIDNKSAVALSMIRFAVDDIPNTLDLFDSDGNMDYSRISSFSAGDYAFLFTYSRSLPVKGLSVGANIKLIRRVAGNFASAWGFGFDIAAKYELKNWKFGANFRDVTSTFNAWQFNQDELREVFEQTGNEIPENGLELTLPRLVLGVGYMWNIGGKFTLYPEIAIPITTDGKRNAIIKTNFISIDPSAGVEFGYNDLVFVRFGASNFQQIPEFNDKKSLSWQPNLGVGVKFKGIRIDYALSNIGNQGIGLYSHIFSLSYAFNFSKNKDASTSRL
ncbi:PorV/PorQ family protein [Bacteroidales bacterium OttesenSCG-928-I21]|nr:PorV/PorQ family protein [Bacteroidales bacterium OttesenSCG-928-I21]